MGQGLQIDERPTRLVVRDPARGDVVAELPVDDAAAVAPAAERARLAQRAWGALPAAERGRALRRARREMVRDRATILDQLERETGQGALRRRGRADGRLPRPRPAVAPRGALARHASG